MLATGQVLAQSKAVSGTVKSQQGEPLTGVTILIEGTTQGTSTDAQGAFTLQAKPDDMLAVSYLGYKSQRVKVGTRTKLEVVLTEDQNLMDEVVVVGYGTQRRRNIVGAVENISGEVLENRPNAYLLRSIQGQIPGVNITMADGKPSRSASINIRANTQSIGAGGSALCLIDGVEGSINAINPQDVESVSVLKDASATSFYGSKAANGVVVINTKRGVKDRTVVTVSNSTTFSKVYRLPDMQNSYGTSSGLMNWGEKYASTFDAKKFFNTGTNIINSVSVSTGNEKNQTYISASTTNTAGIIPENTYDRYNFTARNTTSFAKDKLVLDLGASFIIQHDENMVTQGKYYNPLPALYLFPRSDDFDEIRLFERWDPVRGYMVQYWPYGEGAHSLQNPYWIQNRMNRETSKRRYMLNASLRWNITDWMNVSGRVRVDNSEYRIKQKLYASTLTTFCGTNGGYEDQTQHDRSFYGDVMLNIDKTFGDDWTLNANIGASINDQRYEQAGVAGDLLLTNHFAMNNLNYQEKFKPLQEGWHDQTQAIFASVEVGWRSMLYLTVTGRNDWASQLAYSKNSSFFYPSVGLSAVVSNMVNMPEWFTFLKVRGSYSKVASAFARYLSNPAYSFNNQTHNWSKPSTYPAYNLKPEDTKSWEIGLNARFLNHINLDVTYYLSLIHISEPTRPY